MTQEEAESDAGDAVGLALQRGQLDWVEAAALKRYAELRHRFLDNLGMADHPKAAQFERQPVSTGEDTEFNIKAEREWRVISTALNNAGLSARLAVEMLACDGFSLPADVTRETRSLALDLGLLALTQHLGLRSEGDCGSLSVIELENSV